MTYTNTNTIEKAPGACDSKGLTTDTNGANFRTDGAIQQAHDGNCIATQLARLALAGHTTHKGSAGDFTVFQIRDEPLLQRLHRVASVCPSIGSHKMSHFIETVGYWLIQSAPYAAAILFGVFLGVTW